MLKNSMTKKILVTDDSPHMRTAVRSAIEKRTDWIVYEAEHGGIAVVMVGTHKPHLVILDLSMPVMNGLEAARELKRLLPSVPLVMYEWSQGVETVLYRFQPTPAPHNPQFGVIQDAAGNFYGVTAALAEDEGDIYEVTSQGTEVTLHSFKGPRDGGFPQGSLVLGSYGTLYGTSSLFGKYGQGTVYSYCICK